MAERLQEPLLPTVRASLALVERLITSSRASAPRLTKAGKLLLRQLESEMAEETPEHDLLWDVLCRQLAQEHGSAGGTEDDGDAA